MFNKLQNKIIIITMLITTAVLIIAGSSIMLFSSSLRPEPKPFPNSSTNSINQSTNPPANQEFENYIKKDREEGSIRLLITLLAIGAIIEVTVFIITYHLSQKIIEPVKDTYEKQKLFIANASHELKTPLAVIQANVEAMDVDKKNEKWKDNIETEITRANKLVLDLLSLAKMDAGKIDNRTLKNIDLRSEIENLVELYTPKFNGKINFTSKDSLQQYLLPKQDVLQVLEILLDNATKYGDKKINIKLDSKILSIKNDGAVIPKKDTEKIFDRFYQVDKTREGSGLGLAIVKAICEKNNWQISCSSSNKTTEFILKF